LAAVLLAGVGIVYQSNADLHTELIEGYYSQPQFQVAQGQQLPEFQVAGTMQTGAPAPQGIPLSFQLPVPLPGPSPPAPTVITVGPRAKKAPVCKRCERQIRKIKVSDTFHWENQNARIDAAENVSVLTSLLQRMVNEIKDQNEKADDLMEKQQEMISDYKDRMEEATEKIKDKLLEKSA
jgi:hypothetical protein